MAETLDTLGAGVALARGGVALARGGVALARGGVVWLACVCAQGDWNATLIRSHERGRALWPCGWRVVA